MFVLYFKFFDNTSWFLKLVSTTFFVYFSLDKGLFTKYKRMWTIFSKYILLLILFFYEVDIAWKFCKNSCTFTIFHFFANTPFKRGWVEMKWKGLVKSLNWKLFKVFSVISPQLSSQLILKRVGKCFKVWVCINKYNSWNSWTLNWNKFGFCKLQDKSDIKIKL